MFTSVVAELSRELGQNVAEKHSNQHVEAEDALALLHAVDAVDVPGLPPVLVAPRSPLLPEAWEPQRHLIRIPRSSTPFKNIIGYVNKIIIAFE